MASSTEDFVDLVEAMVHEYDQNSMVLVENDSTINVSEEENIPIRDNDIISINAGGRLIEVTRSTLCLAKGSKFSNMFSDNAYDGLITDSEGRIFIDEDPELIEIIVNFLRDKKREDSSKPITAPQVISEGKKKSYASLLTHFELFTFFYSKSISSIDISMADIVTSHSTVTVEKTRNQIEVTNCFKPPSGNNSFQSVSCTSPLNLSGDGSSWKVTIHESSSRLRCFLGVIQQLNGHAHASSINQRTCNGWFDDYLTRNIYCVVGGKKNVYQTTRGFFSQGECLYFHMNTNKLTMYSTKQKKKSILDVECDDVATTPTYIHFNFTTGAKVTLESLSTDELITLLEARA